MIQISLDLDAVSSEADILRDVADHWRKTIPRAIPKIQEQVRRLVEDAIRRSPEFDSLASGQLREEFGIAEPRPTLEGIVEVVANSITVTYKEGNGNTVGALEMGVLRSDFEDVLSVSGATYISTSKKGQRPIPWLQWLLFEGDRIIITTSELNISAKGRLASRTGRAIMVTPKKRGADGWRVPPEFSGVEDNNWLTRAVSSVADAIWDVAFREVASL